MARKLKKLVILILSMIYGAENLSDDRKASDDHYIKILAISRKMHLFPFEKELLI